MNKAEAGERVAPQAGMRSFGGGPGRGPVDEGRQKQHTARNAVNSSKSGLDRKPFFMIP
jgi:hypothetical protein